MSTVHILRNLLPAFVITLGLGAIGIVHMMTPAPSTIHVSANTSTPHPAGSVEPTATPDTQVTVDGHRVVAGANGSVSLSLPSGKATVQSSGDETTVTSTGDGGMDVSVHSVSTGGTSNSHTNVNGHSTSTTTTSSSSVTSLHGTGQRTVDINQ